MSVYARIENAKVEEVFETDGDITQMFSDALVWVDVTNEIPAPEYGWLYVDGTFTNPYTDSMRYQDEIKILAAAYNDDIINLSDQYAKAALIDGVNENTKKAAIYAEYQARKVTYQADLAALKMKYGV